MADLARVEDWEPVDTGLLLALLHLDERILAGQVPLDPPETLSDDQVAELAAAAAALQALEQQYPRRPSADPHRALPGHPDCIGRFRVDGMLGAGGCAVVYKAHDQLLNRSVAIKVPRFHALATPEIRKRFVREGHAAAQLDHAHIVQIFEAGEFQEIPYIAYAYCDGPTLSQWVKQAEEPMRPRLAAQIVLDLAEAVQYSHDQGILHRDIKPSNVLLFPQNPPESVEFPFTPRLSDLGLAKMIESELEDTTTDVVMGTPLYMAPEQAEGRPEDVGPPSDIYSLGALLFFLLTGRPPFVAASMMETLKQVISQDPILPSVLNPTVDRELNIVCLKCLEKSPECRYSSARALAEDLRRYLAGEPILARPASWAHRGRRWCQRNPVAAVLGFGVVALVVGLIGSLAWNNANSRAFGQRLQQQNRELVATVGQLDRALQAESRQREMADANRQRVEQLLYATDIGIASSARLRQDPREAVRVLRRYPSRTATSDPREFTWYFLQQQILGVGRQLGKINEALWDVEPVPGERQVVLAGSRGTLAVWSTDSTQRPIWSVDTAQREVNSVTFSADRSLLASAGDDGSLAIWNAATGAAAGRIAVFPDGRHVYGVGCLADPPRWIACGRGTTIGIFSIATHEQVGELNWEGQRAVECLAVAPDGHRFATGGAEGGVALWEAGQPQPIREFTYHGGPCTAVVFGADGRWLYSAGGDGKVCLHDIATGQLRRVFHRLDEIHALTVSSAGVVACGDRGGIVCLLDAGIEPESPTTEQAGLTEWSLIRMWAASQTRVTGLSFTAAGDALLSGDSSGVVHAWLVSPATPALSLPPLALESRRTTNNILAAGRSPDEFLRASDAGLESRLVDGGRLREMLVHDRAISACEVLPGQREILLGDADGNVGKLMRDMSGPIRWLPVFPGIETSQVYAMPDSRRAVAISDIGELVHIDLDSGKILNRIPKVSAFCVSRSGNWAAMGFHGSNRLVLVSPVSFDVVRTLATHQSTISQLAASPDDERLVVGSRDRTAVLWDARTWRDSIPLLGHSGAVNAVAISPDGRTIATGDDAGTLSLWHGTNGRQLAEIPLGSPKIRSLTFAAQATALLVGRGDGAVNVLTAPRLD